jgi:hypothetical protein
MRRSMKTLITCLVVFACICLPYTGRSEDWPNDPNYSGKGIARQDLTPYDIQYFFLSTMIPDIAPLAVDPEGAVGMSVDKAWEEFGIGREDVVIAYVEGGINWHYLMSIPELADKIFINAGELPPPCCAAGCGWPKCDNGDGWFNAADYDTPESRQKYGLGDFNANGILDAEDLIVAFSDGKDDDGNGYIDDISGWDFYNDQNNPSTYDTTYTHANSQMMQAAAITNNNYLGAGLCPRCMIMPVKAGAEALDRTDDLAQAWLFAADAGANIIVSTTADLGYSTFMEEAIDYITRRGVVIVESSNDFDSTDHQGGMFHAHVLPGNGLVPNVSSFYGKLARLTTTFRERSSITSWGTHNMFSVPNHGGTTSESTPTVGGMLAMVKSGADDAFDQGLIDQPLSGFELVQVVRHTCSDISDPNLGWAGKPGWDLQYGYGRPNVYKAIKAVRDGEIPPVAVIDVPRWYFLVDPTRDRFLPVEGRISASRSSGYRWELQFGIGPEPGEGEFIAVAQGMGSGDYEGLLTMIDLELLEYLYHPFFSISFALSTTKDLPTTEQYTATLRLRVWDESGLMGEERRSIFIHHDETWKKPFPKYIGPGGESQACLVDLQGQGRLAIVFGESDGFIHALDSLAGTELPGWPVHTQPTLVLKTYLGVNPRYEPIMNTISVGDLDHDGNLWVVATSITGRTYVFDAYGRLRAGWPKDLDTDVRKPAIPRPVLSFTRLPVQAAFAPPVLFDLDNDKRLEIIQAGGDGYIHIWKPDGSPLLGWPKKVELPNNYPIEDGYVRINDQKIVTSPVIADLDGDGDWEIVVMTQYNDTPGADLQLFGKSHVMAYHHDGRTVSGWPAEVDAMAIYYGSAQDFITEGSSSPVACDVDGDGADEIVVSPLFSHPIVLDGNGTVINQYTGGAAPLKNVGGLMEALNALAGDYPMGFTTTGAFGTFDGGITYAQAGSGMRGILQMFLTPGQGVWLKNFERAFDAGSGTPRTGFPAFFQGLNFLGSPVIADVTGDGRCEIIDVGDSSALHAYQAGGGQAPGFPKFTTGWVIWSPSIGDLDADGRVEIVALTREGWLMVWETPGKSTANTEWWHYHHDEWNTGRYGTDTRPPGIARNIRVSADAREIRFTAPGDDWYTGKPAHYMVSFEPSGVHKEIPAYASAGSDVLIEVPEGVSEVTIQAVDNAGNLGKTCTKAVLKATPEEETSGGNHGGGGICFLSTAMR